MNNSINSNAGLIKFQRIIWFFCLSYFALVCALLITEFPIAFNLSHWGLLVVLLATTSQLIVMAEQFRRAGKRRFMLLSYLLIIVILVSVAIGSLIV